MLGYRVLAVSVALALSACAAFHDNTIRPIQLSTTPSQYAIGGTTTATLLPASNYSLVTSRPNPLPGGPPVFCAQPSPDLATAFGETVQATVGGGGGGVTANASGAVASTQTITALAGRTAGVVALRDGLYSACEAYANGMIGKDAYALILSQYGNLLVALASEPGGSAAGVAQLQQQAVQAMLVACLTHSDGSAGLHTLNPVLDEWCPEFMADFMQAVPALLKPVALAPPPKPPTPAKPAPKPKPPKPVG